MEQLQKMMSDNNNLLMKMFASQLDTRIAEHKESTNKALSGILSRLAALEEKEGYDAEEEQTAKKRKRPNEFAPAVPSCLLTQ